MFDQSPRRWSAIVLGLSLLVPALAAATPIEFTASGNILAEVNSFRAAIGGVNNGNTPGAQGAGRREINWDGGGSLLSVPAPSPSMVFQNRGSIFTTDGTGFQQATADEAGGLGDQFPLQDYETEFVRFSEARLFVPVGSNTTNVFFSVPGSNGTLPAVVSAFGAVFSDVDVADATTIQFFDINDMLLWTLAAPVSPGGLSFAGVLFTTESIARVRITTGNAILGATDAGATDVVAMDDFIFAEPTAVPEPATILLSGLGLAMCHRALRRRRSAR